jgi:hypothetical protein
VLQAPLPAAAGCRWSVFGGRAKSAPKLRCRLSVSQYFTPKTPSLLGFEGNYGFVPNAKPYRK